MNKIIECQVVTPKSVFSGKQGLSYVVGISKETVGSSHLHMQLARIPAMSQGKAHKHLDHETAIYALSGKTWVRFGVNLEKELEVPEGSFLYIPAGVPHLPYNKSEYIAQVIIARSDPNEQESVIMLPELDCDFILKFRD
ncbi:cupin domain-containing protein [Pantoea sp. Fr+CA_20]|uniref:cupin domain-containing protein n=1 Tax=Pantoea sp. Fr+CA_20 TaxID=2929506 RepID=UPI002118923D|nr:cupin domain-containing protein [Pantoea sp. Fr+CA_20]